MRTGTDIRLIARNLVRKYRFMGKPFCVVWDDAFRELSEAISSEYPGSRSFGLSDSAPGSLPELPDRLRGSEVLLLAEPRSYAEYGLHGILDFSRGEPEVTGCDSHVLIFPQESLYRIFAADIRKDDMARDALTDRMKPGRRYRVVSDAGTCLEFTARRWIPLDFEVCTAPIEGTVNGKIVVDGAVFFRGNDLENAERIVLEIERGKLKSVGPYDTGGAKLASEYLEMISDTVKDPANAQLAEIGIGFSRGARISDCFMESEASMDTCHFCFGNNACYGGENASGFHGNSVLIRDPRFEELPTPM